MSNSPADIGGAPDDGGWTGGLVKGVAGEKTRCPSCRKPIRFIRMESGGMMPVDDRRVQVVLVRPCARQQGLFGEQNQPATLGTLASGWVPHWVTCSDPNRWRKKCKS